MEQTRQLSFENTEIAFRHSSNTDLKRAYWLFKVINVNFLVKVGPPITNFAIKIGLPIKGIIKTTIFRHFCGGETIRECEKTIKSLYAGNVGTILDYSIEGEDDEEVFDVTGAEILRTIRRAAKEPAIPITVFKVTGVGRFGLLDSRRTGRMAKSEGQGDRHLRQSLRNRHPRNDRCRRNLDTEHHRSAGIRYDAPLQ
jgi:proline dehydrogenase